MTNKENRSSDILDLVDKHIEDLNRIIRQYSLSTDNIREDMMKLRAILNDLYSLYDGYLRHIITRRNKFLLQTINIPRDINSIVIDTELYGRLITRFIPTSPYYREKLHKHKGIWAKKLSLIVKGSNEDKLEIYSYDKLFPIHSFREDIDESWSNLYVLGDEIIIKGSNIPFIVFLHGYEYHIDQIISEVKIDNASLSGLLINTGAYLPCSININNAISPLTLIYTGILSRGKITLKVKTLERGIIEKLFNNIIDKFIYPNDPHGNSWSTSIIFNLFQELQPYYVEYYNYINYTDSNKHEYRSIIKKFFTELMRSIDKRVGIAVLNVSGRINSKVVIPRNSELYIHWYCLPGQYITINGKKQTCINEFKTRSNRVDEAVILLIDSSRNLFSLVDEEPVLEIVEE